MLTPSAKPPAQGRSGVATLRLVVDRGQDELRNVLARGPAAAGFVVIPRVESHRKIQLRNRHRDLAAVAARKVGADRTALVRILDAPPQIAVLEMVSLGIVVR